MSDFLNNETLFGLLILLPFVVMFLWMCARVFQKAGRSAWWTVLLLVPILNIVVLWVFSFAKWPAVEEAQSKHIPEVFS